MGKQWNKERTLGIWKYVDNTQNCGMNEEVGHRVRDGEKAEVLRQLCGEKQMSMGAMKVMYEATAVSTVWYGIETRVLNARCSRKEMAEANVWSHKVGQGMK